MSHRRAWQVTEEQDRILHEQCVRPDTCPVCLCAQCARVNFKIITPLPQANLWLLVCPHPAPLARSRALFHTLNMKVICHHHGCWCSLGVSPGPFMCVLSPAFFMMRQKSDGPDTERLARKVARATTASSDSYFVAYCFCGLRTKWRALCQCAVSTLHSPGLDLDGA